MGGEISKTHRRLFAEAPRPESRQAGHAQAGRQAGRKAGEQEESDKASRRHQTATNRAVPPSTTITQPSGQDDIGMFVSEDALLGILKRASGKIT